MEPVKVSLRLVRPDVTPLALPIFSIFDEIADRLTGEAQHRGERFPSGFKLAEKGLLGVL